MASLWQKAGFITIPRFSLELAKYKTKIIHVLGNDIELAHINMKRAPHRWLAYGIRRNPQTNPNLVVNLCCPYD